MFDLVLMTALALDTPLIDVSRHDEAKLKRDYEKLLASLKPQQVAAQHARAVTALRGEEPKAKVEALAALARTVDPNVLPLMVSHLGAQDPTVRIWAGAAVSLAPVLAWRRRRARGERGD